jgi:hypothetical protein
MTGRPVHESVRARVSMTRRPGLRRRAALTAVLVPMAAGVAAADERDPAVPGAAVLQQRLAQQGYQDVTLTRTDDQWEAHVAKSGTGQTLHLDPLTGEIVTPQGETEKQR